MDFGFSPEQELLRSTARKFLENECTSAFVRARMEEPAGVTDEFWSKLAEQGWLGLVYGEEYGGSGLGFVDLTVLMEEMGRVVMPGPFFATTLLGGVNNGWAVGLTTLMYERLTLGFGLQMRLRIALDSLIDLARKMEKSGRALTKEPVMRQKLAQIWIETECLKYTGARAITKLLRGEMPGPEASTGKMAWVDTHQRLQELAMEIEGPYSQLWKGSEWAIEGGVWPQSFLRSRANSIEGGTTEIQKNIIAERLLGLPKD